MSISRVSGNDRTMLAIDSRGRIPAQLGAVLMLPAGDAADLDDVEALLAERIGSVRRLGQRIRGLPPGCGGPIWVDDPAYVPMEHIERSACPAPANRAVLLQAATDICADRLSTGRPLWRAVLITGCAEDERALVLVLHHALADGMGGLALLRSLLDPRTIEPTSDPRPIIQTVGIPALMRDAMATRFASVARLPAAAGNLRDAFDAIGGLHPDVAADCALLHRPIGRHEVRAVEVDLHRLRAAAHDAGCTINDVLLAAVAGCLAGVLAARNERLDELLVAVPASSRPTIAAPDPGNDNAPLVVRISLSTGRANRLAGISAAVRHARCTSSGSSPAALLGGPFRVFARLGGYRAYLRRQRRFHTILSNVRGPDSRQLFGGRPVLSIVPLSSGDLGNVVVSFLALSYAEEMTLVISADTTQLTDLALLEKLLLDELDALMPACDDGRETGRSGTAGD